MLERPLPVTPLPRAVLFDCDGTLVDSMLAHYEGWREAFTAHGAGGVLGLDDYLGLGGVPAPGIVDHVNRKHGLALDVDSVVRVKRDKVWECVDRLRPLEPAASWARWCHAQGILLAVASGGVRPIVLASLAAAGLDGLFPPEHVFTADEVPNGKPHPDLFLATAARLGVDPADCLVVEDAPPGIEAAIAAGMRWLDVRDFDEAGGRA